MEKTYNKAGKKIVRRLDEPKPKQKRRAGGGRKPTNPDGTKIHCGYRLRPSVIEILQNEENPTLYIEAAILEKFERENIELQK